MQHIHREDQIIIYGLIHITQTNQTKKNPEKEPNIDQTQILIQVILRLINMINIVLIFVSISREVCAAREKTVNITIEYPLYKNVTILMNREIFLEDLDMPLRNKIWEEQEGNFIFLFILQYNLNILNFQFYARNKNFDGQRIQMQKRQRR